MVSAGVAAARAAPPSRSLRRVFEHGAWADRALRAAAERHGLEGRERAQAQRLAYGAVQRRGTADHLIEALAERPVAELDAPVLAALRLGLYELLFAERGAGPRRRRPGGRAREVGSAGAAAAGGGAGSSTPCCAAPRASAPALLAGLDDSTPRGRRSLHSYPAWLAEHVVGGARARRRRGR